MNNKYAVNFIRIFLLVMIIFIHTSSFVVAGVGGDTGGGETTPVSSTCIVANATDDGTGSITSGVYTLSYCINQANAYTGTENYIIKFNPPSGTNTITLTDKLPTITKSVSFNGTIQSTGNPITVQVAEPGTSPYRVFHINASSQTVNITDMIIKGGDISTDTNPYGNFGGGIFIQDGNVNIKKCTVTGSKSLFGGGVFNSGSLSLMISTISGNTATGSGGGITNDGGTLSLISSTISGNAATSSGGGISNAEGTLNMRNSIISENINATGVYDFYFDGGTITDSGYTVLGYSNSAVSNSTTSILYNTKADGTTGYNHWNQNNTDIDDALNLNSTLGDNGGDTLTLALASDSFAAGSRITGIPPANNWNYTPELTDQRGEARTLNQNTSIGAYSENYTVYYYMAKANGTWNNVNTVWFVNSIGGTDPDAYTTNATETPSVRNSAGIIINDNVEVTIDTGGFSLPQMTINSGASIIIGSNQTITIEGSLDNAGSLVGADNSTVTFSGASDSTLTCFGSFTFKTLILNKDTADAALNINGTEDLTVSTALNITRGTLNLSGWTHNLLLGGALNIGEDGRWIKHGSNDSYLKFYDANCTFNDQSTNGPQNLGYLRIGNLQ